MKAVPPGPARLFIETTTACDLRCIHCDVTNDPEYGMFSLPYSYFEQIEPLLRALRPEVQLSGHGETLLHKRFLDLFDAVLAAGCRVEFQTNGTHLTGALIDRLLAGAGPDGLFQIKLSLDAASAGLFNRIRAGADFDSFVATMRSLRDAKARLGTRYPIVGFVFTAMRMNVHELPAVARLAGDLGADWLVATELCEPPSLAGESVVHDLAGTRPAFREAANVARRGGLTLNLSPILAEALATRDTAVPWRIEDIPEAGAPLAAPGMGRRPSRRRYGDGQGL